MKNRKIVPLLSAIALFSGPAIFVAACTTEITRYKAALPDDLQNRILFNFVGVNYSVTAKQQFSSAFESGMDFIKQEVEGIMAQQEFLNFFTTKLNYTEDEANATFTKIKDNLGLNILAQEYLDSLNKKESFDRKVYASKLIFQTDSWHLSGTTRFKYENVDFYKENNPNDIFNITNLYSRLDDASFDAQIQDVAKHADKFYNDDIMALIEGNPTWGTEGTISQHVPLLGQDDTIETYEKKVERFKWWLRFRYQQYYHTQILPKLNETLFTMAYILEKILTINNNNSKVNIDMNGGDFAKQLQGWGSNATWKSNYRLMWEYSVPYETAQTIDSNWDTAALPELVTDGKINPQFQKTLVGSADSLNNTIDPILGMNAFINDPNGKPYAAKETKDVPTTAGWKKNPNDPTRYWKVNEKGSFAYEAPIYWIDVVQNLDFNYYRKADITNKTLVLNKNSEENTKWLNYWNSPDNSDTSKSAFSQFMRGPEVPANRGGADYDYFQKTKWDTFWQMIYFIASQADTNPNKEVAKGNFTTSAKILFPKFIRKENIYNIDFWNAVKEYY